MGLVSNIIRECDERGIRVKDMEKEFGWPRGTVSKWDYHIPSITRVKMVADFLEVTVDLLLKGEP